MEMYKNNSKNVPKPPGLTPHKYSTYGDAEERENDDENYTSFN
jgi:hypothetical protein